MCKLHEKRALLSLGRNMAILLFHLLLALNPCLAFSRPFIRRFPSLMKLDGFLVPYYNSTMGHSDTMVALGMDVSLGQRKESPPNNAQKAGPEPNATSFTSASDDEQCHQVEDEIEHDDNHHTISSTEVKAALSDAIAIASKSDLEIQQGGWSVVHSSDTFSLYKRRVPRQLPTAQGNAKNGYNNGNSDGNGKGNGNVKAYNNGDDDDTGNVNTSTSTNGASIAGPVEYLMTGSFADVSPRTFLFAQIDKVCRTIWDRTMADMSEGGITAHIHGSKNTNIWNANTKNNDVKVSDDIPTNDATVSSVDISSVETAAITNTAEQTYTSLPVVEEDVLYYRTRWPWPLKDRDYSLARR